MLEFCPTKVTQGSCLMGYLTKYHLCFDFEWSVKMLGTTLNRIIDPFNVYEMIVSSGEAFLEMGHSEMESTKVSYLKPQWNLSINHMMCVYCWWSVYSLGLAMERWHIQRCRKRLKKWLGLGRSYRGHAPPLHGFQTFTILYIKLFYGHFFLTSLSSLNVKNLFHFCFPIFNNYF